MVLGSKNCDLAYNLWTRYAYNYCSQNEGYKVAFTQFTEDTFIHTW